MSDSTPVDVHSESVEHGSCVPLCAAARVYGPNVQWWQHEAMCPARKRPADCGCGKGDGCQWDGPDIGSYQDPR